MKKFRCQTLFTTTGEETQCLCGFETMVLCLVPDTKYNETDLILHEAARKALAAVQTGGKLPSLQSLKTEHEKLTQEKSALYQEYNKLKKQMKELDTVKTNIDRILNQPGAAFDKEKSHTL